MDNKETAGVGFDKHTQAHRHTHTNHIALHQIASQKQNKTNEMKSNQIKSNQIIDEQYWLVGDGIILIFCNFSSS